MSKRMVARISTQISLCIIVIVAITTVIDPGYVVSHRLWTVLIPASISILAGRDYLRRSA